MKLKLKAIKSLIVFIFIVQGVAEAQTIDLTHPVEEYLRLLRTENNTTDYPSFQLRPVDAEHMLAITEENLSNPWKNLLEQYKYKSYKQVEYRFRNPTIFTSFNSRIPSGFNDGALWQGRGLNNSMEAGMDLKYKFIYLSLSPQFVFSQNKGFPLSRYNPRAGQSEYASPNSYTGSIDTPQRFGESSYSDISLKNSHLDLRYSGIKAGISSANLWTGPALHNPIVFSNNAPDFNHVYFGTYRPVKTPVGTFEGKFLGGKLNESDYFDDIENNNERFINALTVTYGPSFMPGFYIGATRMIQKYVPVNGLSASDFFEVLQPFLKENLVTDENPSGNRGSHQLLSLMFNWTFPDYGFEAYAEWSRNDHAGDERDLLRHFEHARGYMLGFLKKMELNQRRWIVVNAEMTQLEVPRLHQFRYTGTYYKNGEIPQGFTNRGQLMGAPIGPGSNNQLLSVKLYEEWGLLGVSINRIAHHNDRMYQLYRRGLLDTSKDPWNLHMTEFRLGLHGLHYRFFENLLLETNIYASRFLNYDYQLQNSLNNINFQLSVQYLFN